MATKRNTNWALWCSIPSSTTPHSRALSSAFGLLTGAVLGIAFVLLAGAAVAYRAADGSAPFLDATHLPPLLTRQGERVELRYDVHCVPGEESAEDGPCDATGTVFLRHGIAGAYRAMPLRVDPEVSEGRYRAEVPADLASARDGFTYYAVFRSETRGTALTLPEAGSDAPHRSLPLDWAVEVQLGTHRFGAVPRADARVVAAGWGDGPSDVGLERGQNVAPAGASSFDVDPAGRVFLLDHVHRRLLRWHASGAAPSAVPLAIDGTLADLAVGGDGTIYVLEVAERKPHLRLFGPGGAPKGAVEIAERTASQVRPGPDGPLVLQHPSGHWMPAVRNGQPIAPHDQHAAGRAGRAVPGGAEVIVLRRDNEIRVAILGRNGIRRAWRVVSETPVAEVQLAEPVGDRLVLVARLYTDDRDAFVALVLGPSGAERVFSLDSADWAETAPLSRFRLVGSSLYQLGSTAAGPFVDRFDLGAK